MRLVCYLSFDKAILVHDEHVILCGFRQVVVDRQSSSGDLQMNE